jgi:hypothetical protein
MGGTAGAAVRVVPALKRGGGTAESSDRVPPARITEDPVERDTGDQPRGDRPPRTTGRRTTG